MGCGPKRILELWLGIRVKHVAFYGWWPGMTSLELWLGIADEHEEPLSCGSGWRVLPELHLALRCVIRSMVPARALSVVADKYGSKASKISRWWACWCSMGCGPKRILELWLGIRVKHVAFYGWWPGMTSLELWLGIADEHEEPLSCGSGWRVLPVVLGHYGPCSYLGTPPGVTHGCGHVEELERVSLMYTDINGYGHVEGRNELPKIDPSWNHEGKNRREQEYELEGTYEKWKNGPSLLAEKQRLNPSRALLEQLGVTADFVNE
ncbi:hypothetical protein DEO72_LG5g975 [Vigna unguiculata]|uniref:Uncharacterized protein n=1 Tax=Vigna unguiculata TaxID=3917 RepID=A0A4D6LY50_VIGUN|nr:hypothetical protein DEO72_LG5g975 [Vigna unguiculata]